MKKQTLGFKSDAFASAWCNAPMIEIEITAHAVSELPAPPALVSVDIESVNDALPVSAKRVNDAIESIEFIELLAVETYDESMTDEQRFFD